MSHPPADTSAIDQHYGSSELLDKILVAFSAAGFDPDNLTAADLTRIDQLHMGGQKATLSLAAKVGITADLQVLDIGSGLGGTPRLLASEFGCHVTGVDVTHSFCDVAEALTRWVGLSDRVVTLHGDAVDLPLATDSFDLIWCQHTQMNIVDKSRLISEFSRLLSRGGKLAMHEVFAGTGGTPIYPVPWAADASTSHLMGCEKFKQELTAAGFVLLHQKEVSEEALSWWTKLAAGIKKQGSNPLGPKLIFGEKSRQFGPNVVKNLQQGCIEVHELIYQYHG